MNERISKLVTATDAWCDQNLPSNWTDDVDKYLPVWNEKFAELIALRCSSLCEVIGEQTQLTTSGETARKTKATAESCAYLIKLSFGIK